MGTILAFSWEIYLLKEMDCQQEGKRVSEGTKDDYEGSLEANVGHLLSFCPCFADKSYAVFSLQCSALLRPPSLLVKYNVGCKVPSCGLTLVIYQRNPSLLPPSSTVCLYT